MKHNELQRLTSQKTQRSCRHIQHMEKKNTSESFFGRRLRDEAQLLKVTRQEALFTAVKKSVNVAVCSFFFFCMHFDPLFTRMPPAYT